MIQLIATLLSLGAIGVLMLAGLAFFVALSLRIIISIFDQTLGRGR